MEIAAAECITRAPTVYTVEEFARDHRISRSQTYIEIGAGRLVAKKVGNRTIITAEDAAQWRASLPKMQVRKAG
jgi:hypothetical protein